MIGLSVGLAVLVGIALGLLGGGGSILTVPLLTYVAGLDPAQAITTSLLVVGVTSAAGAVTHARAGRVQWRTALIFGAAGMAGAYPGGVLARFIPGTVLLVGFAAMMIATAVAMLRGRRAAQAVDHTGRRRLFTVVGAGLGVGVATGVLGAGGGFLVVPALALLGGLPMTAAVGTSLVVIAMNALAGLLGHLSSVHIDGTLALGFTVAAVLGALIGARLTAVIDPDLLRRGFGWFVLLMASVILAQEIHPLVGLTGAAVTVMAALLRTVCTRYVHCPFGRPAQA